MILKTILFRVLPPIVLFSTATSLKAQQQYTIQGTLGQDKQGKIMLTYTDHNSKYIKDSAEVKNGTFIIKGSIAEPVYAELELNPDNNGRAPDSDVHDLFLDPGKTTVAGTGRLIDATITGGEAQADFTRLMVKLNALGDQGKKLDSLYRRYSAEGNEEGLKSVRAEGQELNLKRKEIQNDFVKQHPDSYVAFSIWLRKTRSVINLPVMEPEFNAFSETIRNSPSGKVIGKRIAIAKSLEPGNPAIDFTLPDTAGKMVSLSSFKGKNVLLCFWYRNFVPFESFSFLLTKLKKQTTSDNLAIVSVYYNMDNSDWKSVLKENGMTWTNLIDKDGIVNNVPASKVAQSYDLTLYTVPQWLLIGPDGKILGRNFNLAADPVADIKKMLTK